MLTKVMFALHGAERADGLFSPDFRQQLHRVGVSRLQVNIDDAAVAPALRFGPGEPIAAVVSIWTTGTAEDAVRVVTSATSDPNLHAYRVSERVRLDLAAVDDGVRHPVLAQVALLRRPATMSQDEYRACWMGTHTAIAIRTQNTSAYVQNIVEESLTPGAPVLSAIVEEHFPMEAMADPHQFYGSRGDDAELGRRIGELMTSVAAFGADRDLDLVPTSAYGWDL
ncbi:hypothetical protein [Nocardioides baekrokdamisoli]|nr:hypothetical protein [Nocardioides baekrokdamisoli]